MPILNNKQDNRPFLFIGNDSNIDANQIGSNEKLRRPNVILKYKKDGSDKSSSTSSNKFIGPSILLRNGNI